MKNTNDLNRKMNVWRLTWPIFIELLIKNALNASDIFMLSHFSANAVGAVGMLSPIIITIIIVAMIVSVGSSILLTRYLGAKETEKANQVILASFVIGLLFSVILGLFFFISSEAIISIFDLQGQTAKYAYQYLVIYGSATGTMVMGTIFSTIIRCHGHSTSPMVINFIFGLVNILGNYLVLYSPFGLPVYGVQGVAVVTIICQLLIAITLWFWMVRLGQKPPLKNIAHVPYHIYKNILKFGGMNALEAISYNLAQIVIMYMVVKMGETPLIAYTYAKNIERFIYTFSTSLGQSTQIITSYYVGKRLYRSITKKVQTYFIVGFIISFIIAVITYFLGDFITNLLKLNHDIATLLIGLLFTSILLETGRTFNIIFISGLRGSGDLKFPIQIGILSMWGIGVMLSYLLGLKWHYGVIGAWIGVAADEWIRGLIMAYRWRSKKWLKHSNLFLNNKQP